MAELERQLDEMEIHIEDGTLVQVQEQIATQIAAHMEQFEQVHVDMEPYLAHIEKLHEQLEPLHEEMAQIHVDMEPFHREMKKFEVEMEGFERQMEKFHEQMEPLHREMERLQERLDEAVQRELEAYLRDRLGAVAAPGTDFSEGAARIADDARIEIDDGVLELRPRRTDVREVLDDLYGPQRIGTRDAFDAAVDDAAAGLDPLRISID